MSMRDALRELFKLRPLSLVLFVSPTPAFFGLHVADWYYCVWWLRDGNIFFAIGVFIFFVCAILELDEKAVKLIAGNERIFGTQLFTLAFALLQFHTLAIAAIGLPWMFVRIWFPSPC